MLIEDALDASEHRCALFRSEHGAVAAREHEVDEPLAVQSLDVRERCSLHRLEQVALLDRYSHIALLDRLAPDRFLAQLRHPWLPIVAGVPDEGDPAARPQHPRDLAQRRAMIEPVKRLRGRDDVSAPRCERDRLRPALHCCRLGHGRAEVRDHLGERLDRGDPVPKRDERACQLARSGTEVDDVERLHAHEPAHRILRIAGS